MLQTFLVLFISGAIAFGMQHTVTRWDEPDGLMFDLKERLVFPLFLILQTSMLFSCLGALEDRIFFAVYLTMTFIIGVIDLRTQRIHRFFTLLTMAVGILYFLVKMIIGFPVSMGEYFFTVGLYFVLLAILRKTKVLGLGDAIVLFGGCFFLLMLKAGTQAFMIEILLFHFIIANIAMIITNFTRINWKKLKPDGSIAFVPDIYIATVVMVMTQPFLQQLLPT